MLTLTFIPQSISLLAQRSIATTKKHIDRYCT